MAESLLQDKRLLAKLSRELDLYPVRAVIVRDGKFGRSIRKFSEPDDSVKTEIIQAFDETAAIDYIVESGISSTIADATALGKRLMKMKFIEMVSPGFEFFGDATVRGKRCSWTFSTSIPVLQKEALWQDASEEERSKLIERLKMSSHGKWDDAWLDNVSPRFLPQIDLKTVYDVVIIGSDLGGLTCLEDCSSRGLRCLLVEPRMLGGRFLYQDSIPRKCLIESARKVRLGHPMTFEQALEEMRKTRFELSERFSASRLCCKADIIIGKSLKFTGNNEIEIEGNKVAFVKAVIALESVETVSKDIRGLDQIRYMSKSRLGNLDSVPERIAIIGAGPAGCEIAQILAAFGSKVFLFTKKSSILSAVSRDLSSLLAKGLEKENVSVFNRSSDLYLENQGDLTAVSFLREGLKMEKIVDSVMICGGQRPDFRKIGILPNEPVNDYLETSNPNIMIIGSASSTLTTPHISEAMGRLVAHNISLKFPWNYLEKRKFSSVIIPWVIHSIPTLAIVGAPLRQLEDEDVRIFDYDLNDNDGARIASSRNGQIRIICDPKSLKILRCEIMADDADSFICPLSMAMQYGISLDQLRDLDHPYPHPLHSLQEIALTLPNPHLINPLIEIDSPLD